MNRVLIILTLLLLSLNVVADYTRKSFRQFYLEDIKEMTAALLNICPPNDCIVIGLGRSPTPIMAYLQISKIESLSLPFNYDGVRSLAVRDAKTEEYLLNFIKEKNNIIGEKKIAILDYTSSGFSLITVSQFFKTKLPDQTFLSIALTGAGMKPHFEKKSGIDHVVGFENNLIDAIGHQSFDDYSEYYSYSERKNPQWKKLLGFLKEKKSLQEQLIGCFKSISSFF